MLIAEAQREVRTVYGGGFEGMLVSAVVWLASAAVASSRTPRAAMLLLVFGGFFIFPLTTLAIRLQGRPAALGPGNPFRYLAMQVAFVLPLSMPLLVPVVAYRQAWFYPAMMILLGAHYLPFATLYGMRTFLALAALLIGGGVGLALYLPDAFAAGGWIAGGLLMLFAFVGKAEERR